MSVHHESQLLSEPIGVRTLLVSQSSETVEFLGQGMQQLAIDLKICCDADLAAQELCRAKFDGVIVDLPWEKMGFSC